MSAVSTRTSGPEALPMSAPLGLALLDTHGLVHWRGYPEPGGWGEFEKRLTARGTVLAWVACDGENLGSVPVVERVSRCHLDVTCLRCLVCL
jgi:hypothetical protein